MYQIVIVTITKVIIFDNNIILDFFHIYISVKTGSELKEGTTVSMNCQDVESTCKARTEQLCKVKWIGHFYDGSYFICTRQISVDSSNNRCFGASEKYKNRITYQPSGVVNIKNVRRNENGTYTCECQCTGETVESKSYQGVTIVCE